MRSAAVQVLSALFDATRSFDLHRPPELFCGFKRRPGESPTLYPVSCSPQSWSSGAVLMLLQACLGMQVNGIRKTVSFTRPMLPRSVPELRIDGLTVGDARVDLALASHGEDVSVNVLRRDGDCHVVVRK